nr:MAG TPA: hypothetical protein [Caudoviricetes sp.]
MESSRGYKWAIAGAIAVALSVLTWVVLPYFEDKLFHFYCRVALLLLAICTFSLLRLYNAVVANSGYLIRVVGGLKELLRSMPKMQRVGSALYKGLSRNASATEKMTAEVKKFNDKTK